MNASATEALNEVVSVDGEEFLRYRDIGMEMGFLEVVSGPLVRSSYRAERVLEHNNAGLDLNVLQGLRDSATSVPSSAAACPLERCPLFDAMRCLMTYG